MAGCLGAAFLIMASIFDPDRSRAEDHLPISQTDPFLATYSTDPHEGLSQIGTLEDDDYNVSIYATDGGPRYSVYDQDGNELGVLMSGESVESRFPELPLSEIDADTPVKVMYHDPNSNLEF